MCLIYLELGSPYSYLAVTRAERVLGVKPRLQPIVLGAVFPHRGWGSWGTTATRAENCAIVEARAREYGMPPVTWVDGWPINTLNVTRAALRAQSERGAGDAFVHVAFRALFVEGRDISQPSEIEALADEVGLTGVLDAIADPAIKALAKEQTDVAIALGVRGAPTTVVGGQLFFGDDRLEDAAAARSRAASSQ